MWEDLREFALLNIKNYFKAIVIKTVWYFVGLKIDFFTWFKSLEIDRGL